jgi:hypothetical protein
LAQVVDQKQVRQERARKLALDVIDECRVQLMLKFRFLDLALWRMESEATSVQAREAQRDAIKAQRLEDIKTKMREELRSHGA